MGDKGTDGDDDDDGEGRNYSIWRWVLDFLVFWYLFLTYIRTGRVPLFPVLIDVSRSSHI